jgi:hypothetical protein
MAALMARFKPTQWRNSGGREQVPEAVISPAGGEAMLRTVLSRVIVLLALVPLVVFADANGDLTNVQMAFQNARS